MHACTATMFFHFTSYTLHYNFALACTVVTSLSVAAPCMPAPQPYCFIAFTCYTVDLSMYLGIYYSEITVCFCRIHACTPAPQQLLLHVIAHNTMMTSEGCIILLDLVLLLLRHPALCLDCSKLQAQPRDQVRPSNNVRFGMLLTGRNLIPETTHEHEATASASAVALASQCCSVHVYTLPYQSDMLPCWSCPPDVT